MQIEKEFVFACRDHSIVDSDFPEKRGVGKGVWGVGDGRLFASTSLSGNVQTDAASLNLRRRKF